MAQGKYTLVSNRGPNFEINKLKHFAAGGTQNAYTALYKAIADRWICVASDKFEKGRVESKYNDLQVLRVQRDVYHGYYFKYVSEYLYPRILGHKGLRTSAYYFNDFDIVSRRIAEEIDNEDYILLCDYHLFNVPNYLNGNKEIHFFWFLPYLAMEEPDMIYRKITKGLLKSDVLWFLHDDYKEQFEAFAKNEFPTSSLPILKTLVLGPNLDYCNTSNIQLRSYQDLLSKEFGHEFSAHYKYILLVARLDFVKNIPLLLDAIKLVANTSTNVKLLIVAPHHRRDSKLYKEEELKILRKFESLNENSVAYMSNRNWSSDELKILYHFSDIFVLPSTYDAMPLTPMEYILANKGDGAVVVSNTVGTTKFLQDECYIFQNGDEKALASSILRAIQSNKLTRRDKMKRSKYAVTSVTTEKWISKVLEEMDSLYSQEINY